MGGISSLGSFSLIFGLFQGRIVIPSIAMMLTASMIADVQFLENRPPSVVESS
jgi:hypothetical protein